MPPAETLRQISAAFWLSRTLHVVANLGVADALDDTPRPVEFLAEKVKADGASLARVLRLLAAHGVFSVQEDGKIAHTPASRLLREDDPRSLRAMVQMHGASITWAAYGELEHAVRTGTPALEKVAPGGFFAHLGKNPALARVFAGAMQGKSRAQIAGIIDAYDFTELTSIADIGGGRGHLLRAVLDVAPNAEGVLFDLPRVVAEADVASDRLRAVGGDFFAGTLPTCDAYLLSQVLHDWRDEQASAILTAIRRAAPEGARLLVIEAIVSDDPGSASWAKMLDVQMLTLHTGRERTQREYEALLQAARFRLRRVLDTKTDVQILEAVAE